jgi:cytochrome P450
VRVAITIEGAVSRAEEIVQELATPPFPRDPYPLFAELRRLAPVHHSASGMWYATTYESAATVLRSPSFGQGEGARMIRQDPRYDASAVLQALGHMITFIDPPDHTRLRRLVSRAFTPRMIDRLRGYVQRVVDELLEPIEEAGGGDLVTGFAEHIPVTVVCELLGVPHEDHERCRAWTADIALSVEPGVTDEELARADRAQLGYTAYFRALADEKRRHPGDDVMTLLTQARPEDDADGDALDDDELVSMATELIGAGSETTRNLIGSGIWALVRHPDELAQLRADPALDRGAIEECLRYEAPVQTAVPRCALEDVTLEGVPVPAGSMVGAVIGAANHDPARFPDPERFDVDRPDNLPLTFAPGIHYCIGAAVARLEGQIAIATAVRRFDIDLLDDAPPLRPACDLGPNPRGPSSLRVAVRRRSAG